jgi:hypothetical protein
MTHDNPGDVPADAAGGAADSNGSQGLSHAATNRAYRYLAAAVVLVLSTGTIVYHSLEDWSWVDSFYFSAVAVTTVGFGDLTPSSDPAKLFTVAYVFTGIAVVTTYINVTLKRRGKRRIGSH